MSQEVVLRFPRTVSVLALLSVAASLALAQQPASAPPPVTKVTLDSSETLFDVLTSLNACGYDQGLRESQPVRQQVRREVAAAVTASAEAQEAHSNLCHFYRDHAKPEASQDLAQYLSLALLLDDPPKFDTKVPEADLPPDAAYVLGMAPLVRDLYRTAGLHEIWQRHQGQYAEQIERYHDPVSKLLMDVDVYLKLPMSSYQGSRFIVYLQPMSAPGQVNARNYGTDYFVVISPEAGTIPVEAIRHTYLHYVLDPLAMTRATTFQRLAPLLSLVQTAPLQAGYKKDVSLLITESLIRAVEARMVPGGRAAEPKREEAAGHAMHEGFIFTDYFFDALRNFEKEPTGIKDAYGDLLYGIDAGKIRKAAERVEFAKEATPDPLAQRQRLADPLANAEKALVLGNTSEAQRVAQGWLEHHPDDQGHALFILARAAVLNGDTKNAQAYFEQTLQKSADARYKAWSHIFLGRLFDLRQEREAAVQQYRAALEAGDPATETKAAAERGLKHPYEPPKKKD